MVGVYNDASYNNYFGFNLSRLGSTASVTSASLTVNSGLINATMNYTLFGATDLLSQLEANFSPNTNLYDELAAGLVYDDPILTPNTTDPFQPLVFTLNELAIRTLTTRSRTGACCDFRPCSRSIRPIWSVLCRAVDVVDLAGFAGLGSVAHRLAARRRAAAGAPPE